MLREDYARLFNAYNRVVDRIGQKSGMLPIFWDRPAAKRGGAGGEETPGKGPLARAAKRGEQLADRFYEGLKTEVGVFVAEQTGR